MRALTIGIGTLCLLLGAQALAPRAAAPDLVLLDGPQGAWLANVRSDAPLSILEERNGWRRVRLEGWMPAVPAPPAASGGAGPAGAAPQASPTPASGGPLRAALVTGVLLAPPGVENAAPGAGLVALLVGDLDQVRKAHESLGAGCRQGLQEREAAIRAREEDFNKALNSSDNFATAAARSDKAKADLAAARAVRLAYLESCYQKADALFAEHARARAVTDGHGRFEMPDVAPGAYWIVAGEHHGSAVRGWLLDCPVRGAEPVVLDPRAAAGPVDLYWGLR